MKKKKAQNTSFRNTDYVQIIFHIFQYLPKNQETGLGINNPIFISFIFGSFSGNTLKNMLLKTQQNFPEVENILHSNGLFRQEL